MTLRLKRPQRKFIWNTWCIYGVSGGGKSSLAATAPRPFFLDSNKGLLVIADRPGYEHVLGVDVHQMEDLNEAYDNLSGTGEKDWSKKFGTIVHDHLDDIQQIVLEALGDRSAERDRDRRDPDEIAQKEWGIMGNRMRRYLRKIKLIHMHKILICSEKEDRETGRMQPNLSGALQSQLPYFCDHTAYLRIGKNGKRYLHLEGTDTFYAKTRAWWLTPEQRKLYVPFDDTKSLTKLFALIAAGPKTPSSTRRVQEN